MADIKIYGRLVNDTPDGTIAKASQVKDDAIGKFQGDINADLSAKSNVVVYTTGTTVYKDNIVSCNGVLYQVLADSTSSEPSADNGDYRMLTTLSTQTPEFVEVTLDAEGKVLEGIYADGQKYLAKPSNQDERIQRQIDLLEAEATRNIEEIKGSLDGIGERLNAEEENTEAVNETLQDVGERLVVIENDITHDDNPEYIEATVDLDGKVIEGIKEDGTKEFNTDVHLKENVSVGGELTLSQNSSVSSMETPEFVKVFTDAEGKILEGITSEGEKYLSIPSNQDKMIKDYLDAKKQDAEDGKGLIETEAAEALSETSVINNPEYVKTELDAEGKILHSVKPDGKYCFPTQQMFDTTDDVEQRAGMVVDNEGKIIEYIDSNGKKHIALPTSQDDKLQEQIDTVADRIDNIEQKIDLSNKLMKVHIYGQYKDYASSLFYVRSKYNYDKDVIMLFGQNGNTIINLSAIYLGPNNLSDSALLGSNYKVSACSDSILAPLFRPNMYWALYGNHGVPVPYFANTSGLTQEDINSVWKDQLDREFIFLNVYEGNAYFLPKFDISGGEGNITRSWSGPLDTAVTKLTHVSGGVHTDEMESLTQKFYQIRPIMQSTDRKFIIDGQETAEAGDFYCDEFSVSELQIGYDPSTVALDKWFPVWGRIDNADVTDADEMIRITLALNFKGANCAINTTISMLKKLDCQSYGAIQQQFFYDTGDYKAMFVLPKAADRNGITLSKPFNSSESSPKEFSYYRNATYLLDENDPIDRQIGFLQRYENNVPVDGDFMIGMAAGLSLVHGDTVKSKRTQNIPIYDSSVGSHGRLGSFSASNINKFYIAAINTQIFKDDNYNLPNTYFKELNCYLSIFDPSQNIGQTYWYKDGEHYVIYIHCQDTQSRKEIILPEFMEGLNVAIVEKTADSELLTDTVQNGKLFVNFNSSDSNYIVLITD